MTTAVSAECGTCGATNRSQAKFCGSCGALLKTEVICPGCGVGNPTSQRFCNDCGIELRTQTGPARSGAPIPATLAEGRYQLDRLLGEGAGKRVYLATDTRLQRQVAAAVFKAARSDDTAIRRARREAKAMAKLGEHPNVVNVYDFGDEAGQLFLISQYMSGGDLHGLLSEAADHRLAADQVIRIGADIAGGLAHAHGHGVVHRDIKPQNVWLAPDGTVKIGDFGLAAAPGGTQLTAEGAVVGTVAYMAPEQGLGRGSDARSDIYSLGALLYELLCGVPPFVGETAAAVISQHVSTAPVAPSRRRSGVPATLDQLLLKMLSKSPSARPQSAAEVHDTLEVIAAASSGADTASHETAALDRMTDTTFLGRELETRELRSAIDEAIGHRGRLLLVSGETGVGKTRLASEVAAYATLRGAQVLWGRCYAGAGAPAYWPWVQVIRAYAHDHNTEMLACDLGSAAYEIAQIVSEVRERIPPIPEPPPLDAEQARFRLFDSVARLLIGASERRPLAIFLEDLQQADRPSLMLLEFIARELGRSRMFLLGTYRDDELAGDHYLKGVLTSLSRERGYAHVRLGGLADQHVKAMIEAVLAQPLEQRDAHTLADAVCREAEGNPYFTSEIIRHLIDTGVLKRRDGRWVTHMRDGGELGIPRSVHEVVSHRLAKLRPETLELLATAAVIGREFDLRILTRVSELEAGTVLTRIQAALDGAIVRQVPGGPGRYAFAHGATRDALYDDLPALRRSELHMTVGEALERLYEKRLPSHLSQIAYHFAKAAPMGDLQKAADYARRAGERAAEKYAYEDAVCLYQTSLGLLDMLPEAPQRRCDLLLALGDARWRAGNAEDARETFGQAAWIAQELALNEHFARAALGYGGGPSGFPIPYRADERLLAMLHGALEAMPERDCVLRVRVLARLAVELGCQGALADADRFSARAVDMAERLGDTRILLLAMHSRQWATLGPDGLDEALAAGAEIVRLARTVGDRDAEFGGHHLRLVALGQLGEFGAVDTDIAACERLAGQLRQPRYGWQVAVFRTMRALMQLNCQEAERLAQTALSIGRRAPPELAGVVFGAHSCLTGWPGGGLEQMRNAAREAAERYGQVWSAAYVWLLTEIGQLDEARAIFGEFATDRFDSLCHNAEWLTSVCLFAIASLRIEDRAAASRLYELLAPYADRCTLLLAGAGCLGSNHAFLGFAAAAAARPADAARHFELALARNSEIGYIYLTPRICYEYARTLLGSSMPHDQEKVTGLIDQGLAAARQLGMSVEADRLARLRPEHPELGLMLGWTAVESIAQSVQLDRPDLRAMAAPDGTVTIMFSDIEGSTALIEDLGDECWLRVLHRHNAVIRRQVAKHHGFEVKSQGDGFMVAFSSARSAIRCAIDIQRDFAAYRDRSDCQLLRVRIGMHTGEVIREREDFIGRNVTLAARIAAKAGGNQILVSALLRELVAGSHEFQFGKACEEQLKGLREPQRVHEVRWA
ncbi:protein kinase domain-containing protein [Mycobacterium riyadhense]|uniref:non-specific serine/threonine protein kinase n=1 Tax=Mycobacterium riyadhense TaxID=486698 RepID=A0A653F342_9MYCO|nr:protein kinase [Mycobacterium riyadhense]VTP04157.1 Serine/threonine-protein kinase PknB [Mycobacterium riyadhense]